MSTFEQLSDLEAQLRRLGGRSLTRQDLASLRDERTDLLRRIKQTRAVLEGAREPGTAIASWYR